MKTSLTICCLLSLSFVVAAEPAAKPNDTAALKFQLLKGYQQNQMTQKRIAKEFDAQGTFQFSAKTSGKRRLLSEGTGTRGGGSGVLAENGKVSIWDIYRSQHLDQFPQYFAVAPDLKQLNEELDASSAADAIYRKVLQHAREKLPVLATSIDQAAKEIPFEAWVPSLDSLPLIDDYGQEEVQIDGTPVQIAYRRTKQVIYDEKLYAAMDGLNRAALRMHEYIYASSGSITSEAVQQLVSMLFSEEILNANSFNLLQTRFAQFNLLALMVTSMQLPEGSNQSEELARPEEVCGFIEQMNLNRTDFFLKLDVANGHYNLDSKDLAPEVLRSLDFSTKRMDIHLQPDRTKQFLAAFYQAKMHLTLRYPIFLFPAQSRAKDIVCADLRNGRITSVEATLVYNKAKNEAELTNAEMEANYFRKHRNYLLDRSSKNQLLFLQSELNLEQSDLNPLNQDELAILLIPNIEILGHFKVRFEK